MGQPNTVTAVSGDQDESEMIKKMRDLLGNEVEVEVEDTVSRPPLEEAIDRALYSLKEIQILAEYGRKQECVREASEAFEALTLLKEKYIEQNKIMEILSTPVENINDDE